MGRTIYTGRYLPDPVITEIDRGNGMKQLVTEVEPPKKEIQYFRWSWKKPKKDDRWVYHSIAIASIAGIVATLLILVTPIISTIVIGASLAWLGFVGYANR